MIWKWGSVEEKKLSEKELKVWKEMQMKNMAYFPSILVLRDTHTLVFVEKFKFLLVFSFIQLSWKSLQTLSMKSILLGQDFFFIFFLNWISLIINLFPLDANIFRSKSIVQLLRFVADSIYLRLQSSLRGNLNLVDILNSCVPIFSSLSKT